MLGLYPYSSTSLRRNSSASLRCFRFRHKKRRARTISATATIGTTTATAIFPPPVSPELLLDPVGELVRVDEVFEEEELDVCVLVSLVTGGAVEVISSVVVRGVPSPVVGVMTITDVDTGGADVCCVVGASVVVVGVSDVVGVVVVSGIMDVGKEVVGSLLVTEVGLVLAMGLELVGAALEFDGADGAEVAVVAGTSVEVALVLLDMVNCLNTRFPDCL